MASVSGDNFFTLSVAGKKKARITRANNNIELYKEAFSRRIILTQIIGQQCENFNPLIHSAYRQVEQTERTGNVINARLIAEQYTGDE